jgi:hypothetical protein
MVLPTHTKLARLLHKWAAWATHDRMTSCMVSRVFSFSLSVVHSLHAVVPWLLCFHSPDDLWVHVVAIHLGIN